MLQAARLQHAPPLIWCHVTLTQQRRHQSRENNGWVFSQVLVIIFWIRPISSLLVFLFIYLFIYFLSKQYKYLSLKSLFNYYARNIYFVSPSLSFYSWINKAVNWCSSTPVTFSGKTQVFPITQMIVRVIIPSP